MPKVFKVKYVGKEKSVELPSGKKAQKGRAVEVDRRTMRDLMRSPGVEDTADLEWVLVTEDD